MRRHLSRAAALLRYHRPSQFARRLGSLARAKSWRVIGPSAAERASRPPFPSVRCPASFRALAGLKIAAADGRAASPSEGRFRFLGEECRFPGGIDWRAMTDPPVSHLWRFHLHYHEFLYGIAAGGSPAAAWGIVLDWIRGNSLRDARCLRDAWHPYCLSRRLPVWCLLWAAVPPSADVAGTVVGSLTAQARVLRRNLERDLGGNHLLENAKALVFAGAFFEGREADEWFDAGRRLWWRELRRQILSSGEHFERSPMYHAQMLEALLDVRDAVGELDPALAAFCRDAAVRMADWLAGVSHPDGRIPLLADSAFDQTPDERTLLARAGTIQNASSGGRGVGDCWAWRDGGDFLLFDAGSVGADDLPAHAHCDLLTLEVSLDGKRLIVDSGVFDYEDGEMRRYCRSTAAHNVLTVDAEEQCDVWSRFRMGRRGHPSPLSHGTSDGFSWACAAHDAYRRLGVGRVERWVACRPGGPFLCVDRAVGRGRHRLTGFLHLHPDVGVKQESPGRFRLALDERTAVLAILSPWKASVDQGWYCPEFGVRKPSPVIRWEAEATALPAATGWCLSRAGDAGHAELLGDAAAPSLVWSDGDGTIELRPFVF